MKNFILGISALVMYFYDCLHATWYGRLLVTPFYVIGAGLVVCVLVPGLFFLSVAWQIVMNTIGIVVMFIATGVWYEPCDLSPMEFPRLTRPERHDSSRYL